MNVRGTATARILLPSRYEEKGLEILLACYYATGAADYLVGIEGIRSVHSIVRMTLKSDTSEHEVT